MNYSNFIDTLPYWSINFPCDSVGFPLPGYRSNGRVRYKDFYPVANCSTPSEHNREACAQLLDNPNDTTPLRVRLKSPKWGGRYCWSNFHDSFLIPFAHYAPFSMFQFSGYKKYGDWDLQVRTLYQGFPENQLAPVGDMIQFEDSHHLEVLSKGQPSKDGSHTSVTLWGVLFAFLDRPSTTWSNTLTLISVFLCLVYFSVLLKTIGRVVPVKDALFRSLWLPAKERKLGYAVDVFVRCFNAAAYYLTVWISIFCGQGSDFHERFIAPLFHSRVWRYSHTVMLYLTGSTLAWGLLSGLIFSNELLVNILDKPHIYLDNATDFLENQDNYNLMFASFKYPLKFLIESGWVQNDSALWQIGQLYDNFVGDNKRQILPLSVQSHYVINTNLQGCELIMLSDTMWHRKNYNCWSQISDYRRSTILVSRAFMEDPRWRTVMRLLRGIQEGHLMRKLIWTLNHLYYLSGMKESDFVSHTDDVPDISFDDIRNILYGLGYLYIAIILNRSVCGVLYTFPANMQECIDRDHLHILARYYQWHWQVSRHGCTCVYRCIECASG